MRWETSMRAYNRLNETLSPKVWGSRPAHYPVNGRYQNPLDRLDRSRSVGRA